MKKILVILEQENQEKYALEKAVLMAKKAGASVHVLICCFQELSWLNNVFGMLENKQVKDKIIEQKQLWWQDYAKPYLNTVLISHELVWDKYFVESIVQHCQQRQYDFLVKKGHHSESFFYTPSDWLLLRKSPIPAYFIIEKDHKAGQSVLLALDLLASSEEKQKLNKKLFAFASDFASKMSLELHCCFAIPLPKVLTDTGFIDADAYIKKATAVSEEKATSLLNDHIPQQNRHIKAGSPDKVITGLAQKIHADVIIIGSMGKKSLPGKIVGTTCENVMHISKKNVLVISL